MSMMYVWHVIVLVLGARMRVHMRVRFPGQLIGCFVAMELVSPGMAVLVHDRHVDMKMSMLLDRQ